jgi:CRP/FNR family transcriptional regulator, cyclic AMP receptor protein
MCRGDFGVMLVNKFRKLGFIDYNGGIEVHSSLFVVLHDEPHINT